MISFKNIVVGALAGVGTITILKGTMELIDGFNNKKLTIKEKPAEQPEIIDVVNFEEVPRNESATTTVDDSDDSDDFEIDKAWNTQQLSRMIVDFIIKNKELPMSELQKEAVLEYNKVFNEYKVEKIYGEDTYAVIEDYLIFLQIMKDKKIKV